MGETKPINWEPEQQDNGRDRKADLYKHVFAAEREEIEERRRSTGGLKHGHLLDKQEKETKKPEKEPSTKLGLVGLALSGGGIRSATFNLGVLQALEKNKKLEFVDYMCTVSGGGYIGASLSSAYATNADFPFSHETGNPEGRAMVHLREYSKYLAPGGLLDYLRIPALALRGLVVNFLIILPILLGLAVLTVTFSQPELGERQEILDRVEPAKTAHQKAIADAEAKEKAFKAATRLATAARADLKASQKSRDEAEAKAEIAKDRPDKDTAQKVAAKAKENLAKAKIADDKAEAKAESAKQDLDEATAAQKQAKEQLDAAEKEANEITAWSMPSIFAMAFDKEGFDFALSVRSFQITLIFAAVFAAVCGVYPIAQFWRGRETGWHPRNIATKGLAGLLLLVILVAFIEAQPVAIFLFQNPSEGIQEFFGVKSTDELTLWAAIVGGISALFSGKLANKAESILAKTTKAGLFAKASAKYGLYAIGAAGFLVFWLVYLSLCRWAIFSNSNPSWFPDLNVLVLYGGIAIALFVITFLFFDINRTSFHNFYRDRLSKAYLFGKVPAPNEAEAKEMPHNDVQQLSKLNEPVPLSNSENSGDKRKKGEQLERKWQAPYHLISGALNIRKSSKSNLRGRDADFFIFSKRFIGSQLTGYCPTETFENSIDPHMNLGTAMAISGAAAAPSMGKSTAKPLTFIMAFLNVRLGYWLRNPAYTNGERGANVVSRFGRVGPFYLLREMFGRLHEKSFFVNVTDGGHVENLGIYELLRRRCKYIIASDAECDPELKFGSLAHVIRIARIDMGIHIQIKVKQIGIVGEPHCAIATIDYGDGPKGHLLYLKSSVSGDENEYIREYKKGHPTFPHETTGDQFFDEAQFEAYRALGHHIADGAIRGEHKVSYPDKPPAVIGDWFTNMENEVQGT